MQYLTFGAHFSSIFITTELVSNAADACDKKRFLSITDDGAAASVQPEIKIRSLMQYHPDSTHDHVPDPYYGGDEGFDLVYQLVDEASRRFIDDLQSSS